jgi:hypothetical protein
VFAATASYAALFLLMLWMALRGRSVMALDQTTAASILIWTAGSVLLFGRIGRDSRSARRRVQDESRTQAIEHAH